MPARRGARGGRGRRGPEAPAASYRAALFSRDGARAYVTTDREGDHVELYEVVGASARQPGQPSAPMSGT